MYARAANTYRRVSIESATPARILDDIYARLQRDLSDAKTAIDEKDWAKKGAAIGHALLIVSELQASLDHSQLPEVCHNLERLYLYVIDQLTRANIEASVQPLRDAETVVAVLRDAFQQTAAKAR